MNNLRTLRTAAKLTAIELGAAIGAAESTVTAWERGTRQLKPMQAKAIIAVLARHGVSASLDIMYAQRAA